MSDLIIHKTSKDFYKNKSYGNAFLSNYSSVLGEANMPFIKFRCFEDFPWMDAVISTRNGGVSTGIYDSLNLGFTNGDNFNNVYTNYIQLAKALNLPLENFVKTDQVHMNFVSEVTSFNLPAGPDKQLFKSTDGLCTDLCNTPLCISIADCIPVLLVAPDIKMISAVHSGWRGTVSRIGKEAVKVMTGKGARPECIVGLIGPGISQDNYEVTKDVITAFYDSGFSQKEMKDIAFQTDDIHYQLDLWAACYYYLIDAGLTPDNIHFSGICTYENHDLLWSHRFTNGRRGNLNAIIWKK